MEIQISHVASLVPREAFGKVAKAMEVYSGENGAFRCQIVELPRGKSFDPHVHISAHIIYIVEGSGHLDTWSFEADGHEIRIEQHSKKSYPVAKGDFFVIPRDLVHAMSASENETLKELIINIPGIGLHDHRRIVWM